MSDIDHYGRCVLDTADPVSYCPNMAGQSTCPVCGLTVYGDDEPRIESYV